MSLMEIGYIFQKENQHVLEIDMDMAISVGYQNMIWTGVVHRGKDIKCDCGRCIALKTKGGTY